MSNYKADKIGGLVGTIVGGAGLLIGVIAVSRTVYKLIGDGGKLEFFIGLLIFAITLLVLYLTMPIVNLLMADTRTRNLLEKGEAAVATVLEKSDTGWNVNRDYQVELLLLIRKKDDTTYETRIKTLIPRLQPDKYNPGSVLEIKVDPKKKNKVVIVGTL